MSSVASPAPASREECCNCQCKFEKIIPMAIAGLHFGACCRQASSTFLAAFLMAFHSGRDAPFADMSSSCCKFKDKVDAGRTMSKVAYLPAVVPPSSLARQSAELHSCALRQQGSAFASPIATAADNTSPSDVKCSTSAEAIHPHRLRDRPATTPSSSTPMISSSSATPTDGSIARIA